MKIYLAGPMRGYPHFNAPAFAAAAGRIRRLGHECFSPAEQSIKLFGESVRTNAAGDEGKMGGDERTVARTVFHLDLSYICLYAEAVALLPNWQESRGARAEKAVAEALGLSILYVGTDI
jgi:hypothetical protein